MDYRFEKKNKLKSQKQIQQLFANGKSLQAFPLKLVYAPIAGTDHQVGVSVPKRLFKRAVDRNKLKRFLREGYRLHQDLLRKKEYSFSMMFIYTGKKMVDFQQVQSAVIQLLRKLEQSTKL